MTNFEKVLKEFTEVASKVRKANEYNDPKIEAFYQGKLDALKWMICSDIIDLTK